MAFECRIKSVVCTDFNLIRPIPNLAHSNYTVYVFWRECLLLTIHIIWSAKFGSQKGRRSVSITCRLSLNFRKVGWPGVIYILCSYHCFGGRQSDQRGWGDPLTLYYISSFIVKRESWISPPRKLTVRFWSIISDSLCALGRTSGPCRFCSAQEVGN